MRTLIFTLCLFLSLTTLAAEQRMAIITSDIDGEIRDFYLITDDNNDVDSVRYVTYLSSGQILEDVTIPAETVVSEGSVVVERNGHAAVRLEVENDFTLKNGGTIRLNYLYSGITGSRRNHHLILKKHDGFFILTDMNNQKVNDIFVIGNRNRLVGFVGVKEIKTKFKPVE